MEQRQALLSAAQTSKVVVAGFRLHAAWSLEPEALALYAVVNRMFIAVEA
jgi:hypothetical protein